MRTRRTLNFERVPLKFSEPGSLPLLVMCDLIGYRYRVEFMNPKYGGVRNPINQWAWACVVLFFVVFSRRIIVEFKKKKFNWKSFDDRSKFRLFANFAEYFVGMIHTSSLLRIFVLVYPQQSEAISRSCFHGLLWCATTNLDGYISDLFIGPLTFDPMTIDRFNPKEPALSRGFIIEIESD